MTNFCQQCGFRNEANASMCANCGSSLTTPSSSPFGNYKNDKVFLEGIINLRYYTLIGLLSIVSGITLDFLTLGKFSYTYLIGPVGSTFSGISINRYSSSSLFAYSEIVLVVSVILSLFGLYMLYKGFNIIEKVESRVSLGKKGAIIEFIGLMLVIPLIIALISLLIPALSSSSASTPGSFPGLNLSTIIGIAFMLIIAAIIIIIGAIAILIGLFRVGEVFGSTLVEVGAILTLFLGAIGTILLFIGFTNIINNLKKNEQNGKSETSIN